MKNIDRRKFISNAALAGVGIAGAGALLSSCKRKLKTRILACLPF